VHHYNSTHYCDTETVFIYIPHPPDRIGVGYKVVWSGLKSQVCVKSSPLNLIKSTWGRLGVSLASSRVTFPDRSDSQV